MVMSTSAIEYQFFGYSDSTLRVELAAMLRGHVFAHYARNLPNRTSVAIGACQTNMHTYMQTHKCKGKETLETSENINQIKITRLFATSVSVSLPLSIALLLNLYPEAAKRSGFAVSVSLSPSLALLVSLLLNLYHLDHVKLLIAQAINMIAHFCVCMGGGGGGREVNHRLYTRNPECRQSVRTHINTVYMCVQTHTF